MPKHDRIRDLIEAMPVRFLRNVKKNLDAGWESMSGDMNKGVFRSNRKL